MMRVNKTALSLVLSIVVAIFISACTKTNEPELPPQPPDPQKPYLTIIDSIPHFSAQAGEARLVFSTNAHWSITLQDQDQQAELWYDIDPLSGQKGDSVSVKVSVEPNEEYLPRSLTLLLQADSLKESISITQLKKNVILLGENSYQVSSEGQTISVAVRANVDYSVKISQGAEWIRQAPSTQSEGLLESEHSFIIDPNPLEQQREGTIVFKDANSLLADSLTVMQDQWIDPHPQRTALEDIYAQAAGAGWTRADNWCSEKPFGEWFGVETDDQGNVVALRLSRNNLVGTISQKISKLTHLKHLDLSWNKLSGDLTVHSSGQVTTSSMDSLLQMETIDLSHNSLTSEFMPVNWYKMENLRWFDLSSNQLEGYAFPLLWEAMFVNGRTVDAILNDNKLYDNLKNVPFVLDHPQWDRLALQFIRQNKAAHGGIRYDKDIHLPDFTFTDLRNGAQSTIREVYAQNKLTMILHWDPLQEESIEFISTILHRLYTLFQGQGFAVVGIIPPGEEYKEAAQSYLQQNPLPWPVVSDYHDAQGRRIVLPSYPFPSYLLVDQQGKLLEDMFEGQYGFTQPGDMLSFNHVDYLNRFCKDMLGPSLYESSDFSMDKQYELLQKASRGKGIDIVLMGDAFTDVDIQTGFYKQVMQKAMEAFFWLEPTKSYREYFNVYMVYAVSKNAYIGNKDRDSDTAFGVMVNYGLHWFDTYTAIQLMPKYARVCPTVKGGDYSCSLIINGNNGGLTYMQSPVIGPNYSFVGYAYGVLEYFRGTFAHETVGHGFGWLGDEYETGEGGWMPGEISDTKADELRDAHSKGRCLNLSLTSDPKAVYWAHLIGHPRFPYVGIHEGGYYHNGGVWRSESKSVMRESRITPYFNAISRELIVKRILELSGEGYSFEKFLEKDKDTGRPGAYSSPAGSARKNNPYKLYPPIMAD